MANDEARKARLAAALRANLRRRKAGEQHPLPPPEATGDQPPKA